MKIKTDKHWFVCISQVIIALSLLAWTFFLQLFNQNEHINQLRWQSNGCTWSSSDTYFTFYKQFLGCNHFIINNSHDNDTRNHNHTYLCYYMKIVQRQQRSNLKKRVEFLHIINIYIQMIQYIIINHYQFDLL